MFTPAKEFQSLVDTTAGHLHAGQRIDAARSVVALTGGRAPDKDAESLEPLWTFVHYCLNNDLYAQAASLLWAQNIFTAKPRSTQLIWNAIAGHAKVLLQGSASMSKSYATGVYFFLDWLRDPAFTTVKVLGPSEDHLQNNLFSHLVALHRGASLPMPGIVGDLFIGLDLRERRSAITGVIVPLGKKAAGRLQGAKRFPRKHDHPQFGRLSRMKILLDEFEKIPMGIHKDLDNIVSNIEGTYGLTVVGAYNPQDVGSEVYRAAEPIAGWKTFDIETDEEWTSKRGWRVVRLDAHKSENVLVGKTIYPGIQTKEGLEELSKNSGGEDSPGYYTFGRGAYPPQGATFSIIPASMLVDAKAEVIWMERPVDVGAVDSALEGSDSAMLAHGKFGLAVGLKFPPCLQHPDGHELRFKNARGVAQARHILQLTQLLEIPRGDTVAVAKSVKEVAQKLSIAPEWLILDRTGNGSGVHDLLKEIWSPEVRGVNYTETATTLKICAEDSQTPKEAYDRVYSELWFATRKWTEFSILKILPAVECSALFDQFTNRLYFSQSSKQAKVESKRAYKARGFKSPNEADAVTLLVHCVRVASQISPPMNAAAYETQEMIARGVPDAVMVGVTDRLDDFDAPSDNSWPPRDHGYGGGDDLD